MEVSSNAHFSANPASRSRHHDRQLFGVYLCSGEENSHEVFTWLMRWMAYPLQNPGAKLSSAIIMHGPQGTGKSTVFETLAKIYGKGQLNSSLNYSVWLDQKALQDTFNADWENKLFVLAEEVVNGSDKWQLKNELEAEIHKTMVNSFGVGMRILAAAIDSRGHRTEQVKGFVMRTTLKIRVYSVQGSTTRLGRAIAQSGSYPNKNHKGKVIRHGYCAWNVGTEHCKDFIFGNLAADGERVPDDRVFHFPQGLDDSYYDGVLSETYDPEHKRYVQRLGARYKRNEPLDTLVYAWAIGQHREINIGRGRAGRPDPKYWERLAVMLEPADRVVVAGKLVDASVQISVPALAPAKEPLQQFQQLHDSGFGKDGWGL